MPEKKYAKYVLSKEIVKALGCNFDGTSVISHDGELGAKSVSDTIALTIQDIRIRNLIHISSMSSFALSEVIH